VHHLLADEDFHAPNENWRESAIAEGFAAWVALLRALSGTVHSLRDGDFSSSLSLPAEVELAELVVAHNALGDLLRVEQAVPA
jgi:hypothetical protein